MRCRLVLFAQRSGYRFAISRSDAQVPRRATLARIESCLSRSLSCKTCYSRDVACLRQDRSDRSTSARSLSKSSGRHWAASATLLPRSAVYSGKLKLHAMGHPSDAAGLPRLDRERFRKVVSVKAIKLSKTLCHRYVKMLRSVVLASPKIKAVQTDDADPDKRRILLREDIQGFDSPELPQGFLEAAKKDGVEETSVDLQLDYSHASLEAVLKEILPDGFEIPSSFETIGHIAHLNLRDECLPYRYVIGQVVLDKNPAIKTVVNKVGSIENEYRVLPMEVIAGEDRLEATVRQHSAQFKLHFREVYWNSRLEQEHQRLVGEFKPDDVIADVMAGIGPFAIPSGLQGLKVYANDLNPRSVHYLKENIRLNKVAAKVAAFEMDGREFIRRMAGNAKDQIGDTSPENAAAEKHAAAGVDRPESNGSLAAIPPSGVRFHHAIMNLPASAIKFLDAFRGAFDPDTWKDAHLPLVHVYTFAKGPETASDLRERAEEYLGGCIDPEGFKMRLVRDVAPNKRMMLLTFRVPAEVAFADRINASERCTKRQRID